MNVLDKLGVNTLSLRGKGTEFNSFSRLFKSKEEAMAAVTEGDYIPTEGKVNAVIIMGHGIMIYSFDLQEFISITELVGMSNQANRYVELDGADDYINLQSSENGSEDVLDFTKSWSIGITLVGVEAVSDSKNVCLFGKGGVRINLKRGGSNWGLYVTSDKNLYNTTHRAQANTWYAPQEGDRILFVYDHTTRYLKYLIGSPVTGIYAQKANLLIPTTMRDGQDLGDGSLVVGQGWSGVGGSGFSAINWDGGVNNMIVTNKALATPQITEYFQSGDEFQSMELYPDLTSYLKLGEDTYPEILDTKGNITGGELVNGAGNDFVDIPEV
jgi:hypothetical protein